jgi:hypothetical protein
MKKNKTSRLLLAPILSLIASLAFANSALAKEKPTLKELIVCHEALEERSEGTSEKLTQNKTIATPFVFKSDGKLIFVTDTSMSILGKVKTSDGKMTNPVGQVFAVSLTNQGKEVKYQIEVRKNGDLGSVCCSNSETTMKSDLPEGELSDQLTPTTRDYLTQELYARLQTFADFYRNRDYPDEIPDIIAALNKCKDIRFKTPIVSNLLKSYELKVTKPYGAPAKPGTKSSNTKKAH